MFGCLKFLTHVRGKDRAIWGTDISLCVYTPRVSVRDDAYFCLCTFDTLPLSS